MKQIKQFFFGRWQPDSKYTIFLLFCSIGTCSFCQRFLLHYDLSLCYIDKNYSYFKDQSMIPKLLWFYVWYMYILHIYRLIIKEGFVLCFSFLDKYSSVYWEIMKNVYWSVKYKLVTWSAWEWLNSLFPCFTQCIH